MDDTLTGFLFCVYEYDSPDAPVEPYTAVPSRKLFLRSRAEAKFLEHEMSDPLYEACEKGIATSDDEVFSGSDLDVLEEATRHALSVVGSKPATWPVMLGYRSVYIDQPIAENANRDNLLHFLAQVLELIAVAKANGSFVHWLGGE